MDTDTAARADAALAAARSILPHVRAAADTIEQQGCLPPDVMAALSQAGLFRLQTPLEFGGFELDHVSFMRVVEEIAQGDGSTAWVAGLLNSGSNYGSLPAATIQALHSAKPDLISAGSLIPTRGKAVAVDGGYRVTGHWTFVSGCRNADWLNFACLLDADETASEAGRPQQVLRILVPVAATTILECWNVGGLRGTGSHDVKVQDLFVPDGYAFILGTPPLRPGTLWVYPQTSFLGLGFVSVGLGLARRAIDTLKELAGAKQPLWSKGLLRERAMVQADVARAEVYIGSARTYLHSLVSAVWAEAEAGRTAPLEQRALLRGAVVHAAETAAQVVDLMCIAAGTSSLYTSSPLERCSRDVRAVRQQIMLQQQHWEPVGRVLLGLNAGSLPL